MNKVIWTCWFQGRENAPELVKNCLDSWERMNPGWDFRCLDRQTIARYIEIDRYVVLHASQVTPASLSDIVRIALLHEYGGVWVDSTLSCNRPLDDWLPESLSASFFAFSNPGPGRMVASWFLAVAPGSCLVGKWAAATARYWRGRARSDDYFWFHHLFGEVYEADSEARAQWDAVPKIAASGPYSVQYANGAEERQKALEFPVSKHSLHSREKGASIPFARRLAPAFGRRRFLAPATWWPRPAEREESTPRSTRFAGLKVKTQNAGDHIQILAADRLLARFGVVPEFRIDRDDEIATDRTLERLKEPVGLLVSGWFKTNPAEWPPHPIIVPLFLAFHIRLFQAPTLVSEPALAYYRSYGPIGCRDRYTRDLLGSHDVDAFVSHCLTLLFPRRLPSPDEQRDVLVVSRDRRILDHLPTDLGRAEFISHYTGTRRFDANLKTAGELIERYRTRARLIVTTMLHCALPAIAMGIPVVVFYPIGDERQHQSDMERFSSLADLIPIYRFDEIDQVDWRGHTADVGAIKRSLVETFHRLSERWTMPPPVEVAPSAPPQALPIPSGREVESYVLKAERLQKLKEAKRPDRLRWGDRSSYRAHWADRSALAASLIPDGTSVFEAGAGAGDLRRLVAARCRYVGSDLSPVEEGVLKLDLDRDAIPGAYDYVVALGVFEYLHFPEDAARRLLAAGRTLVVSYCCVPENVTRSEAAAKRGRRGWVNAFSEAEFIDLVSQAGGRIVERHLFLEEADFRQMVMVFECASVVA